MESKKSNQILQKIPDPVVLKNNVPIKAMKVLENYIVLG